MTGQRHIQFAILIVCVALCGIWYASAASRPVTAPEVFDTDPNHIWNRTYACLFMRKGADGTEYGADTPDPLLWDHTRYLMSGESHRRAIACLDDFLNSHAERVVKPIKRAVLQHDLWAVFDWVNRSWDWTSGREWPKQDKEELEKRLVEVIRRLSLTPEQIRGLPDTYATAVAAKSFATDYDSHSPHQPFLPPDLFRAGGPWVCLSAYYEQPTVAAHFTGRSRFLVLLHLPGGRDATLEYLSKLRSLHQAPLLPVPGGSLSMLNLALPQFPVGTEVVLVRQAILIDSEGRLVTTALTEDVQLRVYHAITPGGRYQNDHNGPSSHDQDFFEFRMSRPNLFTRQGAGGLVAVMPGETEYATFSTQGMDPFEFQAEGRTGAVLGRCLGCHSDTGIHSVQSRVQWLGHWQATDESRDPIAWKPTRPLPVSTKDRSSCCYKPIGLRGEAESPLQD